MPALKSLAAFFGLKRNLVILLIAIFVIGAGEELWMRFVPKYLQAVGATVFVIGLYDALRTLLGAIYAYPWRRTRGPLGTSARVHHLQRGLNRRLCARPAHSKLGRSDRWNVFLSFMELFFLAGNVFARRRCARSTSPFHGYRRSISDQTIADHDCAHFRRDVDRSLRNHPRRANRACRLDFSFRLRRFLSNANCAKNSKSRWNQSKRVAAATAPAAERWSFWRSLRQFNPPMRRLLLSDILIRFCERVPYAWVVIFAMDYIGMSAQQVGVLTAIEMLAATLCIIPASHYADRYRREPFVIVTFIMFTLFPISLLMSRSFSALVIAFTIRGLKEFGDTSRKALIIGYC